MFGIFYSGEEILFSLDTIGNIAERRKTSFRGNACNGISAV